MSGRGEVTVYSPDGTPMEQFYTDAIITNTNSRLVGFKFGDNHIMDTTLPFICEGEDHECFGSFIFGGEMKFHVKLFAWNGKLVREFDCERADVIQDLWKFQWQKEALVMCVLTTSFPAIVRSFK